jgi:hypothetical protein
MERSGQRVALPILFRSWNNNALRLTEHPLSGEFLRTFRQASKNSELSLR